MAITALRAKNGIFFGKYKKGNVWHTKWCSKQIVSENEAQAFLEQWETQRNETNVIPLNEEVVIPAATIDNLAKKWLAYRNDSGIHDPKCKKTAKGTKRQFEHHLKNHILPHRIAKLNIDSELDTDAAIEFIQSIKGAARTVRNVKQSISTLIHDARFNKWIKTKVNVFKDTILADAMPLQVGLAGSNVIINLNQKEIEKLLASENVVFERKIRYMFAVLTGARANEINAIAWDRIDFAASSVAIERQLDKKGAVGVATFIACKADSERILPLHPKLIEMLREWHATGWKAYVGRDPTSKDSVFPKSNGDYYNADFADYLRKDLALAGLPTLYQGLHAYTFHALRRSFATMLNDAGVQERIIKQLMGHRGQGVADRYYIARNLAPFAEAISKLLT